MTISSKTKNFLLSINWLDKVGTPLNDKDVIWVNSVSSVSQSLESPEWEDTTLEAANAITAHLSKNHPNDYQNWNIYADEAKEFIETSIMPVLNVIPGLDQVLVSQNVSWDIVHFILEDVYADVLRRPLFFRSLIKVYEQGHLPCGWSGQWPNGNLLAY